ncbi:hypothetical protein ACSBR1_024029 [Camellia fascicularis]
MELVSSCLINDFGSFWLTQLWLWAYFPEFASFIPAIVSQSDYFGLQFLESYLKAHTFDERFTFFYRKLVSRDASTLLPFRRDSSPSWLNISLFKATS